MKKTTKKKRRQMSDRTKRIVGEAAKRLESKNLRIIDDLKCDLALAKTNIEHLEFALKPFAFLATGECVLCGFANCDARWVQTPTYYQVRIAINVRAGRKPMDNG